MRARLLHAFVRRVKSGDCAGIGFDVRNRNDQDVDDEIDVDGEDEAMFGVPQFTEQDVLAPHMDSVDVDGAHLDPGTDAEVDIDDAPGLGEASGTGIERDPKEGKTLRDLVAEGKVLRQRFNEAKRPVEEIVGLGDTDKIDLTVELARRANDQSALVRALESKIQLLVSPSFVLQRSQCSNTCLCTIQESTRVSSSTSLLCRICLDPYSEPTVSTGCWHTCCRECWLRCLGSTKLCPICKRITGATDLRRVYL